MNTIISFSSPGPDRFVALLLLLALAPAVVWGSAVPPEPRSERDAYAEARDAMVERQLRRRGIDDRRVLQAMRSVPRHLFVPPRWRSAAYEDRPLPIGSGQTISQPYVVALMTQLLELQGSERVLEVGTGSGYQAAVLSRLAREVFSVEIIPELSRGAADVLERLGFDNVRLKIGDGFFGWEDAAPFDAIVVTAAASEVPEPLWRQLAEGGRLVIPLGDDRGQRLVRLRKLSGKRVAEDFTAVLFVPLTGEARKKRR
ncbi:MAG TPA: protein-L-isoaspartate(D-aspartate) O-methyltransferase [candidate division Zixibacteria bacterium]|nr:protein-L-isoaspartate(D-aspartate) O-methyltransferase [candidate division Zixibacteria bacterium]